MEENRAAFLSLLKKHGVRYDFCGHDHGYRTGSTNGTTLVVSGSAGAPLYHEKEAGGFNHYVAFAVAGTTVSFQAVPISR